MRFLKSHLPWFTTPILVLAFVTFWHYYVVFFEVSEFILPKPSRVADGIAELLNTPSTYHHMWITAYETLCGFLIAVVAGVFGGVVLAQIQWLERTLRPFIVATQVVPKIALVPLFILWFGFGPESKIIISSVLAFFPIFTNTLQGVKSIEWGYRDVMTSLNAGRWQILWNLELPAAMPAIITGMEIGVVLAVIGTVVGEYLGGSEGLGYLAVATLNAYHVHLLFGVIVLLALLGFGFYFLVSGARRLLIPWHQSVISRAETGLISLVQIMARLPRTRDRGVPQFRLASGAGGSVKLSGNHANWLDEKYETTVPWVAIPSRNYQSYILALSPDFA